MNSGNPVLSERAFGNPVSLVTEMTIEGTINKTILLLALVLITAGWTWHEFYSAKNPEAIFLHLLIGTVVGFVVGLVIIFKMEWAPVLAPLYALLEGLAIGGISAIFEIEFPGIVIQAVALTFGTLFCLLFAYSSGFIKVTKTFWLGVVAATGAICLFYIIEIVLLVFFGIEVPFIHESGVGGIIFSIIVVCVAALNLVLDFDLIRRGAESGAPKYMELYGAFALIVTLLWLYLEILELLGKTRS